MLFNKLTIRLQAFDKPLLKKLNAYLSSPYFNVQPAEIALYKYLEKLHPGFDEKKLEPEIIIKKVPELFDLNKQKKTGSQLLKAVEHFLAVEQWEMKPREQTLYLLQGLKKLELQEIFETTAKKFSEQLENCPEKDIDYFRQKHLLSEIEYNGFQARLQRNSKNNLHPITQTLDNFYAVKKVRYHCELLSRHQVLGTPYSEENLPELLQLLQPVNNPAYPYVYLFANIYEMMSAPAFEQGENHYRLLHRYIEEAKYSTLPQGVYEAIPYLINYCLFWNNNGFEEAGSNALHWYELLLKHNLLLQNGMLEPGSFRSIVSLAIIHGKNEKWLSRFIADYSAYLPAEQAPTNLAFVQGQYFYYVKNYEKAMPLFQQAQAKDEPIFNMIVRRWQFICMYEQNPENKQVLLDFLNVWERLLHRTAPSLHRLKQVFGKVISYSKKLLAATTPELKKQLTDTLEDEPFFAGRNWLLEQLKK